MSELILQISVLDKPFLLIKISSLMFTQKQINIRYFANYRNNSVTKFTKFTGKKLCPSLFFNKVAD